MTGLVMPVAVAPDDPDFTPAPPPWRLRGRGLVALYRRPDTALLDAWVPAPWRPRYVGGPAALMLVDYLESDAGPYRELLFVPGRFDIAGGVRPMITRIVVSTWESVANGRLNWAIPKEQADFRAERADGVERWLVSQAGEQLAELAFRAIGPPLPVTTALLPGRWTTVAQPRGEQVLLTSLEASGRCRLARLETARFGPGFFPDLAERGPLASFATDPFEMTFPVPETHSDSP